MALAAGPLTNVEAAELAGMSQLEAEATARPMQLLGFMVLSNQLHPASKETIAALQEK